ncbi:precorrin-6y C5,15-methyltransferase (decarboxylating) subunit CbiE [Gloeocapsopsis dulcis]|uniref:tRNA (guanine(46)-N(7))-methyltransferase n=1 Tax=Gloeocapsopsis dulcis AAB1 = 1H9 TaxID=1433147 RepID=A0A6N8FVM7_9CHRO|nr:precorrin-6y C5,15-methyltransferase (decarboxylating) subunit CbiE [Gloeocapsopsis dulcis]MUL37123.1 cobalamin biosynthesis bifunctional protein CbiET [Gloeocapsopsis dulcis AAB1 = 1H9]WNN88407.1 precorrin-6y C5,15-methyltransferase (decarboxylating) subunit CbiE [Gloeocapsopsis dulcis]
MSVVHVVGIGLDGREGLSEKIQQIIAQATLLIGSDRHLSYFPQHPAQKQVLGDFTAAIERIHQQVTGDVVVLVTGDPLFFGLGRLLLAEFPPEKLVFHPHLSSVQLAFNAIKVPWQDAKVISVHGRSLAELIPVLQQGVEKIAILTDNTNNPSAIARLLQSLDLPSEYQFWVCENLGSQQERVQSWSLEQIHLEAFAPLNVVILLRQSHSKDVDLAALPQFGLPDGVFLSFSDRPGLMTKREVRVLILGELALQPGQIVWDIGAGTGSVAIEIARLFPTSRIYAVEKTTAGTTLIQQNCDRLQVKNIVTVHGSAPEALTQLPTPDRVFIGGSGGNLVSILEALRLSRRGIIVLALATVEHLTTALDWLKQQQWNYQMLQVQLSRSVPIADLTRFTPLNPVTILSAIAEVRVKS